jgi:hypothetical protein
MAEPFENDGDLLLVQNKSFLHGFALGANIKSFKVFGLKNLKIEDYDCLLLWQLLKIKIKAADNQSIVDRP